MIKKKQKTARTKSERSLEVTSTSVGAVDFTKQLDNLRFQDPDAKELMYAPGIVNYAKIYKELRVNGVDSALKMVRSIKVDQAHPAQRGATKKSHAKQSR